MPHEGKSGGTAGGVAAAPGGDKAEGHKSSLQAPDGWTEPEWSMSNFVPAQRRAEARGKSGSSRERMQGRAKAPMRRLTADLVDVYQKCKPDFAYHRATNPRRCLTKPAEPTEPGGSDNADADLIVFVGDVLVSTSSGRRYTVVDKLGQGTFGQVMKCDTDDKEGYAIKIIRNKPAYTNQALVENLILSMANQDSNAHVLKYYECFTHKNHLCLVSELLAVNLYELLRQNSFRGLSLNLIRVIIRQCLDALVCFSDREIIHCDLKPENVMLKAITSPQIKVIDLGSACFENHAVYTYIQSRFYRSPEVLLRLPFGCPIDVWSLGCIGAELFLGLPLWPGTSEYNQIAKIVDSLGMPPKHMLDQGKWTSKFFECREDEHGNKVYSVKSAKQFEEENDCELPKERKYFKYTQIKDLVEQYPVQKNLGAKEQHKEQHMRVKFAHFLAGVLQIDPAQRWTAKECLHHPFITNSPHDESWTPPVVEESKAHPIIQRGGAPVAHGGTVQPGAGGSQGNFMSPPQAGGAPRMMSGSGQQQYMEQFARMRDMLGESPCGTKYPPFYSASIGKQRGGVGPPQPGGMSPGMMSPGMMSPGMGAMGWQQQQSPPDFSLMAGSSPGGASFNYSGPTAAGPYGSSPHTPQDSFLMAMYQLQLAKTQQQQQQGGGGGGGAAPPWASQQQQQFARGFSGSAGGNSQGSPSVSGVHMGGLEGGGNTKPPASGQQRGAGHNHHQQHGHQQHGGHQRQGGGRHSQGGGGGHGGSRGGGGGLGGGVAHSPQEHSTSYMQQHHGGGGGGGMAGSSPLGGASGVARGGSRGGWRHDGGSSMGSIGELRRGESGGSGLSPPASPRNDGDDDMLFSMDGDG